MSKRSSTQGTEAVPSGAVDGGPTRILLVEDQTMVAAALASLIEMEDDLTVVGQLNRGDEAVAAVVRLTPDVVVLDIDLPGLDGISAAARIVEQAPQTKCLMLTALTRPGAMQRALRAGARGFIVKHAPAEELLAAIRAVAAGGRVLDPELAAAALEGQDSPLTDREIDVVRLLAQGASAREIAKELFLSEGTVRNYTSAIAMKCGARNRVDLVRICSERGWL